MKSLPQKITPIALIGVCLIWLGVGVYSYFSAAALIAAQEAEAQTWRVLLQAETLLAEVKDMARTQHGYVITGAEDYLTSHQRTVARIPASLTKLRQLLAPEPAQTERLNRIEELIAQSMAIAQRAVRTRQESGFDAAIALTRASNSHRQMSELTGVLDDFVQAELGLLETRVAGTSHRAWRTLNALVAINLLALLFIGLVFNTLRLELRRSRRAEAELQQAKIGLEERVMARTAELTQANTQLQHEAAERAGIEAERRRNAEQLRLITDAVPALIAYVDAERRYRFVNGGYLRWFGHQPEEIVGRHIAEVLGETAYEAIRAEVDAALSGRAVSFERLLPYQDGGTRFVRVNYVPDFGPQDEVKGYFALISDLTEYKQATDALRRSEERYRALTLATTQFIWVADEQGLSRERIEWWGEFTGQTAAEADGTGWLKMIHPDDRASTITAWQQAMASKEVYNLVYRVRHRSGTYHYFHVRGVPVFNQDGSFREWVGTMTDISERKRAELNAQFLIALDAELSRLTDAAEIERTTIARLGQYLAVARCHFAEVAGEFVTIAQDWAHEVAEVTGNYRMSDFAAPEFLAQLRAGATAAIDDISTDPRTSANAAKYALLGTGAMACVPVSYQSRWTGLLIVTTVAPRVWREDELQLLRDVAARVWPLIERARTVAQLRESQERFSKAFAASPHLMTISTLAEGRYVAVNDAVLRSSGYTRAEMVGHTAEELGIFAEPEGRAKLLGAFHDGSVRDLEIRLRMKGGLLRTLLLSAEIITVAGEQCILTVSHDITERKQSEEVLRRSEERYRAFVAQSSEAIWRFEIEEPVPVTLPPDEQIQHFYRHAYLAECNDVMARQYGYASAQEIIGARLADLMPPTDPANIEYLRQFIAAGYRLTEAESHEVDRAGQPRYFLNNLIGIVEDGWLVRAWGTQRDITERKEVEDALRESEARFRTLADSAPVMIWVNDTNLGCEFVNQAYLDFFGKRLEEVQGFGWQPLLHPDDTEQYMNAYRAAFQARLPFHTQTRVRRADGEWRWIDSYGLPRFAPSGEFLGYVGSSPDITETKRAELDAQFLADLSEVIRRADDPEELMGQAATAVGEYLQVAQCFFTEVALGQDSFTIYRDYHRDAPSLAGTYQRSAFSPEVIAELNQGHTVVVTDAALDPRTAPYQATYRQFGIAAFVSAPLLRGGRQVSSLIVCATAPREWTARETGLIETVAERAWLTVEKLRAEAATTRLLEQEQRARAHAEAANRSKDEFLAVLSHELRSPLNAIIGWNRILGDGRRDDPEIAKVTEIVDRNARTQLQLIEDLLDTARLISGKLKLELQPVALIDVVGAALDVVRPAAEAKGIEIHTEFALEDCQLLGDPARLQQVVWNLLANSVKFTPTGGHITVRLRRVGAQVELVINDTGRGIKPDFLPHVFDRFAQADGTSSRRYGGLGLGLSLVHHLVEMHGGTITAESAGENRGATFTIKLPLRAIAPTRATPSSQEDHALYASLPATLLSLKGVRALVVDDEPDARELITTTLNQFGAMEVQAVASGAEALEILRGWTPSAPSVLICDIGLPDEDGYEVIKKVRALKSAPNGAIKAIALTALGRAEDRLRALQAGFQMHIAKPVERTELVVVINTLLGNRQ